jgi:hypothetical protein
MLCETAAGPYAAHCPGAGVVDNLTSGQDGEGLNPEVHTNNRVRLGRSQHGPLDLDSERHEPTTRIKPDRSRHHPRIPSIDPPHKPGCVLMHLDPAQSRQDCVFGLAADRPCGEPDAEPAAVPGLEPGKPNRSALAFPCTGVTPVLQRPRQPVKAGVERLF